MGNHECIEVVDLQAKYVAFRVTNFEPEVTEEFDIKFNVVKSEFKDYVDLNFQVLDHNGVWKTTLLTTTQKALVEVASLNENFEQGETLYASIISTIPVEFLETPDKEDGVFETIPISLLLLALLGGSPKRTIYHNHVPAFVILRFADRVQINSADNSVTLLSLDLNYTDHNLTMRQLPDDCIEYITMDTILSDELIRNGITNWSLLVNAERVYRTGKPETNLIEITDLKFTHKKIVASRELDRHRDNFIIAFRRFSYEGDTDIFNCSELDSDFIIILIGFVSTFRRDQVKRKSKLI